MTERDNHRELLAVALVMKDWIDAVPDDTELPVMPGFDRDWAESVMSEAADVLKIKIKVEVYRWKGSTTGKVMHQVYVMGGGVLGRSGVLTEDDGVENPELITLYNMLLDHEIITPIDGLLTPHKVQQHVLKCGYSMNIDFVWVSKKSQL